jgi:BspA type Leucine rich repeat region (6 copies)/Domain of unknown function (DUF6383)
MKKQSILFLCLTLSTILSAQVSKTVDCTAGALSSLLSASEISTVTDLTLTGTIDARDFMTMRDSMPSLKTIDMGTVTIAAYQNNLANQIPAGAFRDTIYITSKTTLTSIVMPTGTTSIGTLAFYGCEGLTGILTIPNSVTSIGDDAFRECSGISALQVDINNSNYSSNDGILYNKDKTILIKCPAGKSGSLTIPNSVTTIGDNAFYNCNGLTGSITIPNSVTSIGNEAFVACSGLTGSLTIPNSVNTIGYYAFYGCKNLLIDLSLTSLEIQIGIDAFIGCQSCNKTVTCTAGALSSLMTSYEQIIVTNLAINGTIDARDFMTMRDKMHKLANIDMSSATIASYQNNLANQIPVGAFFDSINWNSEITLTSIVMPFTTTSIGRYAFKNCKFLAGSFTIPISVTCIGSSAFYNCSGFTGSLTIPNSVMSIGDRAFYACSGLTGSLTIPNSVTSIGDDAFRECSGLSAIQVDINNSNYCSNDGILYNKDKTMLIKCPAGKSGSLTIPNSVTTIGDNAFCYCKGLTGSLSIPNSVTSIGDDAFYGCSGFTGNLTIPNSLKSIGDATFKNCSGFNGSLTIGDSVTNIGNDAFSCCFDLTGSLTIPNSVTSIGSNAFLFCYFRGNLLIPNSVTYIGEGAFESSGFTGNLTISNSVTRIGWWTFSGDAYLTGDISIPNSVTSIENYAFSGCSGFDGRLTIPCSVKYIGQKVFNDCRRLTSIKAESKIPVDLTNSLEVFSGVNTSTCTLYVPKGSKTAYQSAYQWKDFTNIVEFGDITTNFSDITSSGTLLYIADGQLHIKNAPAGETVSITAMSGMVVYIGVITSDELSVALPQSGVYIVTVGNRSQKVAY